MNDGKSLESYVQYVYNTLLNLRDEGVLVTMRPRLRGKSGAMHEVDVYYEFERAGVRHRVAIECKDHARPVSKGDVSEFYGKVNDIGGISAIVVSRNGYQEGAVDFAKMWNIELMTVEGLPSMGKLLGKRLEAAALPDEKGVGEPFWTIMEMRDGQNTGSYFCNVDGGRKTVPLFLSKTHALMATQQAQLDPAKWAVRGLPRHVLRSFILMMQLMERSGTEVVICLREPGNPAAPFVSVMITREELANEYYGEPIPRITPGA
jgi:hypothetical protein